MFYFIYYREEFLMKKLLTIFITIIISSIILTGCNTSDQSNNNNDTIFGKDLVKYNLDGTPDFGFNLSMITKNKDTAVEFVSFTGENTQGLTVTLSDDSYETIKNLSNNGYFLRLLGFTCNTGDSNVVINGVNLTVDGKEIYVEFKTPIKHNVTEENLSSDVQITNYPLFISTNSYDDTEYTFEYYTENDITVEDFSFNDFLSIANAEISVDGEVKGSPDLVFPLSVKKDSTISLKCNLAFKDDIIATDYDNIYCDSLLTYSSGDAQTILHNNLVSQGVSNEEDAKNAIDLMLGNVN